MYISTKQEIYVANQAYEQKQGVIIDDKFLSRDEFKQYLKNLLYTGNPETIKKVNRLISYATKVLKQIQQRNKQFVWKVVIDSEVDEIISLFKSFMGNLGGVISLLTTFNFDDAQHQTTYFLAYEKDLINSCDKSGYLNYNNIQSNLEKLSRHNKTINKLNNVIRHHFINFSADMASEELQDYKEYVQMIVWSYYHMKESYDRIKENREYRYPTTLNKYFWGYREPVGYVSEAFGAHLALVHPDILNDPKNKNINFYHSVINELGGPGSQTLFNLLQSVTGNVSGHLSGDIVIINDNGEVNFNIQSKSTMSNEYEYKKASESIMENIIKFCNFYFNYLKKIQNLNDETVDYFFKAFSTNAWAPIKEEIKVHTENNIEKALNELKKI